VIEAKIAIGLGVALALAVAAALLSYEKLETERAAHNATRGAYARDKALWITDQRSANATIKGLQGQAKRLMAAGAADREAEAERFRIFFNAGATPEGNSDGKTPDAADTDKAVVRHLNRAFGRVVGLQRGPGN
jgi:hypothetical protein